MAERLIRVGRVSSVNAETGMIKVTYPDLDDAVTTELPLFSFTEEYKMPKIDAEVLVLHLSSGESVGIVLGRYWNNSNKPPVSSGFWKGFADDRSEAYMQYDDGILTIKADSVRIIGNLSVSGSLSVGKALTVNQDITAGGNLITNGYVLSNGDIAAAGEVSGGSVASESDVTAGSVSLASHKHTDSIGGSTSGPH